MTSDVPVIAPKNQKLIDWWVVPKIAGGSVAYWN